MNSYPINININWTNYTSNQIASNGVSYLSSTKMVTLKYFSILSLSDRMPTHSYSFYDSTHTCSNIYWYLPRYFCCFMHFFPCIYTKLIPEIFIKHPHKYLSNPTISFLIPNKIFQIKNHNKFTLAPINTPLKTCFSPALTLKSVCYSHFFD